MKVDKLMFEVDHGARRAYEERAAAQRARAPRPRGRSRRNATPPEPRLGRITPSLTVMGRIYDATWGRGFAAGL